MTTKHNLLIEPLKTSAPLALELSKKYCRGCAWYHGLWQYLRIYGLGKTLSGQSEFFNYEILQLSQRDELKILISGCADYSLLAHIQNALHMDKSISNTKVEITVLDVCQTPLKLCEWYASQFNFTIKTIKKDILEYQPEINFDLIVTSSFLGYFQNHQRILLFKKYSSILKSNGLAIFTNRLSDTENSELRQFTNIDTTNLLKIATQQNLKLEKEIRMSSSELHAMVELYCKKMQSHPVSKELLFAQLNSGGLYVKNYEERLPVIDTRSFELSGPTLTRRTPYACIVATPIEQPL